MGQPFQAVFRASARNSRAEARLAGQEPCPILVLHGFDEGLSQQTFLFEPR